MSSHEIHERSASRAGGSGWLVCLLLVTFTIGTDDFVVAGVLPPISADLDVSEAAAGQLVTVFSVTYALAALPLAVLTATLPRRTVVLTGLTAFAVVNLLTALAPSYALLMTGRVIAALIAAVITPAVFSMAARAASPDRVGRAIGTVAAGLTVSLVVGVPIGTVLGDTFGWRSTFVAVGLFSVLVAAVGGRVLPRIPGAPEVGVAAQLRPLGRAAVLLCAVGTVLGASSGLMVYTYVAPVTHDLTGRGGALLAGFIGVVGVAGAVGTFVGGRLTDRWGADRTLLTGFAGMLAGTVALAALGLADGPVPVWLVAGVLAGWGFAAWGFNPPMNARIMRLAGDAGTEAVALNTSALYVGIAVAGAVGGWMLTATGAGSGVPVAAALIGAVALTVMAVSVRRHPADRADVSAAER